MGYAKYHEDDLRIIDDRIYMKYGSGLPSIRNEYVPPKRYAYYCPFCRLGADSFDELSHHVFSSHGSYQFVYLNNRQMKSSRESVAHIYSLKLFSFSEKYEPIELLDDMDNLYSLTPKSGVYEYDLQDVLVGRMFSSLNIRLPKSELSIIQNIDIREARIDKILSDKYCTRLFDYQVSEDMLDICGSLTYIKMMIHEGQDTEPFMNRIEYLQFDDKSLLPELYLYYSLDKDDLCIDSRNNCGITHLEWKIIQRILYGNYSDADKLLHNADISDHFSHSLRLSIGLLQHDELAIEFYKRSGVTKGLFGMLNRLLLFFKDYMGDKLGSIDSDIKEISLFVKYPLVRALVNLYSALADGSSILHEDYALLRKLSPIVPILYCQNITDDSVVEKIYKSTIKLHKGSSLLKEYAFRQDYPWLNQRLRVCDGDLYRKALDKCNQKREIPFSPGFIATIPLTDDIRIMSLGGGRRIGASCILIECRSHNILLDVGIDPMKNGDDAYPDLDAFDGDIDAIIISHAHIDHCGGVPKAHAMWKGARILCTAPTKVFMQYLYSDMAKVKNGISNDFEIENIQIEKNVMEETLRSIVTIAYEEWVHIADGIDICLHPAGHIVGAAMIELRLDGKTMLYTGDFSDFSQSLVSDLTYNLLPKHVDYLLTEATYVDKPALDWGHQSKELKKTILSALKQKHAILLPAPSIGRSQELMCLIGEMYLAGEIPVDTKLYLGGMAIPTTTQISPFLGDNYSELLGLFEEFDGQCYPDRLSVTIASSGTMSRGSASYKIARFWNGYGIPHSIILGGSMDEETENESRIGFSSNIQRCPLATHADRAGLRRLIDYTMPKLVSFVHSGGDLNSLYRECRQRFKSDIGIIELEKGQRTNVFDLLHLMEEKKI